MKDKKGIEITLGIVTRYLDMPLNDRIIQSLHIEPNRDYVLSEEQLDKISPDISRSVKNNLFEIPKHFLIPINELEDELERKVGLQRGILYYSPVSCKSYLYYRYSGNWSKRDLDDWEFHFEVGTYRDYVIRSNPIEYGQRVELSMEEVKKLNLRPQEGRYIKIGDCFYSKEHNQFVRYTRHSWYINTYYFENPFQEIITLNNQQIDSLKKVDFDNQFYAIRPRDVSSVIPNENGIVWFYEEYISGHYRGEDSGAIYPEYDEHIISEYDLNPLFKQYNIDANLSVYDKITQLIKINHVRDIHELLYPYPQLCISGVPLYDPPVIPSD